MVLSTTSVAAAVAPGVISTFFNHYFSRKERAQKPTAHISYDQGLTLIRKFILFASQHTVEDIQHFTSQGVPSPAWVKVDSVDISTEHLTTAAEKIQAQLGHHGVERVGGKTWWQWRRPGGEMKAEWIEMRSDYNERKKEGGTGKRVMLYVHGGAYYFGSVDEHRYQMQRHARKLKARVFAPRYRLSPQFPFPCGLQDCLAAYLHLLTVQDPTTIILAGDSAGGGMVLSMLVVMRDQGIPLPAGAILISPWVDLTHSFPSCAEESPMDYLPTHGFHHKPSVSWPPPTSDEMLAMEEAIVQKMAHRDSMAHAWPQESEADAVQGFHVDPNPAPGTQNRTADQGIVSDHAPSLHANTIPGPGRELSIMIDTKLVVIKEQIQMYATNQLISHPLVSPALQPSLGGLPPLLILVGGGEALRDEQIYVAHKAANPAAYPPGNAYLDDNPHDHNRNQVNRWKPTDVQLQVWEDLCHVAPTLSFTRPAKYMYRSIAQFGAWALARAQKTEIDILDDDNVSVISRSESDAENNAQRREKAAAEAAKPGKGHGQVGKAGDPLPPFKNHMIRQRVDRNGNIAQLEPASQLPGCNLSPSEIGVIKPGPLKTWMAAKVDFDAKFSSTKRQVQKQRAMELAKGYHEIGNGEVPPPSALVGRRLKGGDVREEKKKKSVGMSFWSFMGSKHDKMTMDREHEADALPETVTASAADGAGARPLDDRKTRHGHLLDSKKRSSHAPRSKSRRRAVTDEHQTDEEVDENTPAAELIARREPQDSQPEHPSSDTVGSTTNPPILVRKPTVEQNGNGVADEFDLKRPKAGGIAFPFTVKGHSTTASMTTLTSDVGVHPAEDVPTNKVTKDEGKEAERPPMETFVTARTQLPLAGTAM